MADRWVTRFDLGVLQPPVETPEGFLRVTGYASRCGVFEYENSDGTTRRELRLPQDVFDGDSLKSYEGRPFTNGHPGEPVTVDNARSYQRGTVLRPGEREGDHVAVAMMITDANAIADVKAGKRELSSGYRLRLEDKAGVHPVYGKYDAIQRDIRINHLALVGTGRAGPSARIRVDRAARDAAFHMDGAASVMIAPSIANPGRASESKSSHVKGDRSMKTPPDPKAAAKKEPLDPANFDAARDLLAKEQSRSDELATQLDAMTARAEKAEGSLASVTEDRDALKALHIDQAQLDAKSAMVEGLEAKVIELEKERDDAQSLEKITELVHRRVGILDAARPILGDDKAVNFDQASNKELMVAVIEKLRGVDVSDRSDDFIQARFEDVVSGHVQGARALAAIRQATVKVDNGGRIDQAKTAREKYKERQNNSWKSPDTIAKGA